jgi:glycosyltransferase involved in cell wall biosynthesis
MDSARTEADALAPSPPRDRSTSASAHHHPRVCLLHNYREDNQMSMMLYAAKLGDALERAGAEVVRVRPRTVLPASWRKNRLLNKFDSYAGRFVRYPAIAKRLTADVFHVVDHGQGYLLSFLDPSRTVVTCHDIILLALAAGRVRAEFRPPLATAILRKSLKLMQRARAIIAVSHRTRQDLADLVGIDPATVRVIYSGLNHGFSPAPHAREAIRKDLGLPAGPLVLHVGQTGFYKNIPGCLRVIERLRREGLPVTLVRAGHRMTAEQLAVAEKLGVSDAVTELGPVSVERLADLYRACDVLLFPSLYEGFGWPPLEAMASGLPVVCSREGSLGEIVADAALTAEPEDVVTLADHVAAVLTRSHVAARLRGLGLERATLFDWRRTATQVADVYRQVIGA